MKKKGREWYKKEIERSLDITIFKRKKRYTTGMRFYMFLSKTDRFNRKYSRTTPIKLIIHSRKQFLKLKGYI